jgi:3-hydroxyisobutyrate dehydrogenase
MIQSHVAIGWIGTGVMGAPMCGHLLAAGYPASVYSRTRSKTDALLVQGARWCDSPAEVAANSGIIFTMVGTPDEVRAVYFAANGVLSVSIAGKILVDMSTTAPSLSNEIAATANALGAQAIDAPVSGGDVGARNATLSVMVGGERDAVAKVIPLFDHMAKTVTYMGEAGSGQHTKLCNQIVVAGTMIGVCEALLYAVQSGVDAHALVNAISKGAAGCWTLDNLAPRINRKDFTPGFMVDHFVKDLGIALAETTNLGICLPGLELALQLYQRVQQLGHGRCGTQALIHALQSCSA